ncbi:MAG: c-type cytochrome [Geminicoccaceae bacterium]
MMRTFGTAFTLMIMAALMIILVMSTSASAADIKHGEMLAKQWCSNCHVIGGDQVKGADSAPAFAAIAETAADRTDDLHAWLADPHPPMPNLSLTKYEIDDLLAYIRGLSDR